MRIINESAGDDVATPTSVKLPAISGEWLTPVASIHVHCVLRPIIVADAAGRTLADLDLEESATFEVIVPRFLWWRMAPRWRRVS